VTGTPAFAQLVPDDERDLLRRRIAEVAAGRAGAGRSSPGRTARVARAAPRPGTCSGSMPDGPTRPADLRGRGRRRSASPAGREGAGDRRRRVLGGRSRPGGAPRPSAGVRGGPPIDRCPSWRRTGGSVREAPCGARSGVGSGRRPRRPRDRAIRSATKVDRRRCVTCHNAGGSDPIRTACLPDRGSSPAAGSAGSPALYQRGLHLRPSKSSLIIDRAATSTSAEIRGGPVSGLEPLGAMAYHQFRHIARHQNMFTGKLRREIDVLA
jgi:hypothetical protein